MSSPLQLLFSIFLDAAMLAEDLQPSLAVADQGPSHVWRMQAKFGRRKEIPQGLGSLRQTNCSQVSWGPKKPSHKNSLLVCQFPFCPLSNVELGVTNGQTVPHRRSRFLWWTDIKKHKEDRDAGVVARRTHSESSHEFQHFILPPVCNSVKRRNISFCEMDGGIPSAIFVLKCVLQMKPFLR